MKDHDRFDDEVRALVGAVEQGIPPTVEEQLQTAAQAPLPRRQARRLRRRLLLASLAGAAALLLAVSLIPPAVRSRKPVPISKIRTEIILADKDITIIFVQKPDFPPLVTPN
jgi:ferric-dicitrate binding protein FerR (iron transport regulator)